MNTQLLNQNPSKHLQWKTSFKHFPSLQILWNNRPQCDFKYDTTENKAFLTNSLTILIQTQNQLHISNVIYKLIWNIHNVSYDKNNSYASVLSPLLYTFTLLQKTKTKII